MTCCCNQKHQSLVKAEAPGFFLDGGDESDWSVDDQGTNQTRSAYWLKDGEKNIKRGRNIKEEHKNAATVSLEHFSKSLAHTFYHMLLIRAFFLITCRGILAVINQAFCCCLIQSLLCYFFHFSSVVCPRLGWSCRWSSFHCLFSHVCYHYSNWPIRTSSHTSPTWTCIQTFEKTPFIKKIWLTS